MKRAANIKAIAHLFRATDAVPRSPLVPSEARPASVESLALQFGEDPDAIVADIRRAPNLARLLNKALGLPLRSAGRPSGVHNNWRRFALCVAVERAKSEEQEQLQQE